MSLLPHVAFAAAPSGFPVSLCLGTDALLDREVHVRLMRSEM